jgi:ubiquinone/menaquinone biosynthesis C-methylase UbiE
MSSETKSQAGVSIIADATSWWGGDVKSRTGRVETNVTVKRHIDLLARSGRVLAPGAAVLDYGCGDGALAHAYRDEGYDAWGVDIHVAEAPHLVELMPDGRLPFPDETFDLVVSETVLEHVMGNQEQCFREIARVLKPGGIALHLFPPRTALIESHTRVPLGSFIQSAGWIGMWARIGVRATHQRGLSARVVGAQNARYLAERTNYLSRRHYIRLARRHYARSAFVERDWLLVSARRPAVKVVARLAKIIVPIAWAYDALYFRVMLLEKEPSRAR